MSVLLPREACCRSPASVSQSFSSVQWWWWVYPCQCRPSGCSLSTGMQQRSVLQHTAFTRTNEYPSCSIFHLHCELCFHFTLTVYRKHLQSGWWRLCFKWFSSKLQNVVSIGFWGKFLLYSTVTTAWNSLHSDLTHLLFYTEITTYLDKATGSVSAVQLSNIDHTCNLHFEVWLIVCSWHWPITGPEAGVTLVVPVWLNTVEEWFGSTQRQRHTNNCFPAHAPLCQTSSEFQTQKPFSVDTLLFAFSIRGKSCYRTCCSIKCMKALVRPHLLRNCTAQYIKWVVILVQHAQADFSERRVCTEE